MTLAAAIRLLNEHGREAAELLDVLLQDEENEEAAEWIEVHL